jgi:hypothetical protein
MSMNKFSDVNDDSGGELRQKHTGDNLLRRGLSKGELRVERGRGKSAVLVGTTERIYLLPNPLLSENKAKKVEQSDQRIGRDERSRVKKGRGRNG